jgi:HIV Tat-specific factor 1
MLIFCRKLNDWSSDEEASTKVFVPKPNKWANHVILKNAFTIKQLDEDPLLIAQIKEEMEEEGETCGEVINVIVYDREPEGVVVVRFRDADAANRFVALSNGRGFGTDFPLAASIAIDRPKFKKSGKGTASDEEEEIDRLERFISDE